jgi:hypothetical protein
VGGGRHGHLPLLISDAKFIAITGILTATTTKRVKPGLVDARYNGNSTNFDRLRWTREQDEKIMDYQTQEEADDTLKEFIIEAVDPQYIEELKMDYVGYGNETAKTMLHHIKSTWCKITTREKGIAQQRLREPWNLIDDITSFERALDKSQAVCLELEVPVNDSDKVQIYVENMYVSDMFDEKEMVEWEEKEEANKDWAAAKTYFGTLYKKRMKYNSDMKARGAGFESANSFAQSKRSNNTSTFSGGATVVSSTSAGSRPGTPLEKATWVEYSDSLEDSLTEAKEYAAAMESKADATQATLMAKLEIAMEQNTKLLAMMTSGGFCPPVNENLTNNNQRNRGRKGRMEPRVCKHCGPDAYHEDDDCFKLEKNKSKRPQWYIKKYGE